VRPEVAPDPGRAPGPRPQDVDVEMLALSQNTVHYQALVRALGKHLSILGAAISEGRRG
jgi:flagellar basal-body rod protein FlgB